LHRTVAGEFRDSLEVDVELIPEETCGGGEGGRVKRVIKKRGQQRKRAGAPSAQTRRRLPYRFEICEVGRLRGGLWMERLKRGRDAPDRRGDWEVRFGRRRDNKDGMTLNFDLVISEFKLTAA